MRGVGRLRANMHFRFFDLLFKRCYAMSCDPSWSARVGATNALSTDNV